MDKKEIRAKAELINEEKNAILKVWQQISKENDEATKSLCKEYGIILPFKHCDEYIIKFETKEGYEFEMPSCDDCFENDRLKGKALEFAEKYNNLSINSSEKARKLLLDKGFKEEETDEYMVWYRKEDRTYSTCFYVNELKDIELEDGK